MRINHADRLLESTDQSITQIAFACGYNSDSYFIKTYRRKRGRTPTGGERKIKESGFEKNYCKITKNMLECGRYKIPIKL